MGGPSQITIPAEGGGQVTLGQERSVEKINLPIRDETGKLNHYVPTASPATLQRKMKEEGADSKDDGKIRISRVTLTGTQAE